MKWEEELQKLVDGLSTELHLVKIKPSGKIRDLTDALRSSNSKLEFLSIRNNGGLALEDIRDLASALQSPESKIKYFEIFYNKVEDEGSAAIAFALLGSPIRFLGLGYNQIGHIGALAITNILREPACRLKYLVLDNNKLGDEGAIILASGLPYSSIIHLSLSKNSIGNRGIEHLSHAFTHPDCSVRSLNLNDNKFDDHGIIALSDALVMPSCNIVSLDLMSTNIQPKGAEALARLLGSPTCKLIQLDVTQNSLLKTIENGTIRGGAILRAIETNQVMLNLKIAEPDEEYTICREADEMSKRNNKIFHEACISILGGDYLQPNDREMVFLQCHVISRYPSYMIMGEFYATNVQSIEEQVLAQDVLSYLQHEYDTTVMDCFITLDMPQALAELAMSYIKDYDSQLYVSFYKPIEDGQALYNSSSGRKRACISSFLDKNKKSRITKEAAQDAVDHSESRNGTIAEMGASSAPSDFPSGGGGAIAHSQIGEVQTQSYNEQSPTSQLTINEQSDNNKLITRIMD